MSDEEFSLPRPRGLAAVSVEKRREIARMGGVASHRMGKGHQWTPQEARDAGRKGGKISNGGKGKTAAGEPVEAKIMTLGSSVSEPDPMVPKAKTRRKA